MSKRYSIAEPVRDLRHIKIRDNGEPLVDYLELCPKLRRLPLFYNYTLVSYARESVARMLARAADALPTGYHLAVLEGWRPLYIQRRMYKTSWERFKAMHPDWSDLALKRVVNRFTAPIDARVPPPHSTGGALDLGLLDDAGQELDLISPFDRRDRRCYLMDAPGLSPEASLHRRILSDALLEGGLTNYPSEFWHWSYGDQGWAYRTGAEFALYDTTQPPGWSPVEADAVDEVLERVR